MSFSCIKDGDDIVISIPSIYGINVVKEVVYALAKDFTLVILEDNPISIKAISCRDETKLKGSLVKSLNDFLLRNKIDNETKNIKELIIAKAFSMGEFDEPPYGDANDPVEIKY